MRIVVVGCSGSGKTTMARRLAEALDLPRVELDALNWDPGWRNLSRQDLDELRRRIAQAAARPAWVIDGNYIKARDLHWSRATTFVWMDTPKWRVMAQVVWRSFLRAIDKRELWPGSGNREHFRTWINKEHPIRWAWDTWSEVHDRYADWFAAGAFEGRPAYRVRNTREALALVARLKAEAGRGEAGTSPSLAAGPG